MVIAFTEREDLAEKAKKEKEEKDKATDDVREVG